MQRINYEGYHFISSCYRKRIRKGKKPACRADDSLLGYLKGLQNEGVEIWYDNNITAGELWDEKIRSELDKTHIALVLVSQWFLDSPYCNNTEISSFLAGAREKGLIIIPVILSACEWKRHHWLASRQIFPGGNETLAEHYKEEGKRESLFLRIKEAIRTHIAQIQKPPEIERIQGQKSSIDFSLDMDEIRQSAKNFTLADIFRTTETSKTEHKFNTAPKTIFGSTMHIVPATDIAMASNYIVMKLDWELQYQTIDAGNGILTQEKLEKVIDKFKRDRDNSVLRSEDLTYITGRLRSAKELLQIMKERKIDALDYMPLQLKELPAHLRYSASEIMLMDPKWQGGDITQETIDNGKRHILKDSHSSESRKLRLAELKEIANFLGLID